MAESTFVDTLKHLTCINRNYTTLPIEHGFNWHDCFTRVAPGEWYLVVFRSRHRAGIACDALLSRDEQAQQEARQSPGFLYYFAGTPDEQGNCLSFCFWENASLARSASHQPNHRHAQALADTAYEFYHLERYLVRKTSGGSLVFEKH